MVDRQILLLAFGPNQRFLAEAPGTCSSGLSPQNIESSSINKYQILIFYSLAKGFRTI
jgi:hypothetical protein